MSFIEDLKVLLENQKDKRRNEKTIKMYISNINKLYKILDNEDDMEDLDWLTDVEKITDILSDKHFTTLRNYLNSIIVSLQVTEYPDELIKEYQSIRDEFNDKYIKENSTGVISAKQEENFATMDEINGVIKEMKEDIDSKKLFRKDITPKEKALVQMYVMINILTQYPFRNDLAGMKLIKKKAFNNLSMNEKKKNNYLLQDKNDFYFILNEYKTQAKYGEKKIKVEKNNLPSLLRKYIPLLDSEYLFVSSTGKPFSRNALTQILSKTFEKYLGKKISTTLLRKIYMSSKYQGTKNEMEKDAEILGHEVGTGQLIYTKSKE
jgi:integrase